MTEPGPHSLVRRAARVVVTWFPVALLCAIVASWVASYVVPHSVPLFRRWSEVRVVAEEGTLQLWHTKRIDVIHRTEDGRYTAGQIPLDEPGEFFRPTDTKTWWSVPMPGATRRLVTTLTAAQMGALADRYGNGIDVGFAASIVAVPHWLAVAVLAPLAFLSVWRASRRRRARRIAAGLCAQCGYDVRASPERCPECNTATPKGTVSVGTRA